MGISIDIDMGISIDIDMGISIDIDVGISIDIDIVRVVVYFEDVVVAEECIIGEMENVVGDVVSVDVVMERVELAQIARIDLVTGVGQIVDIPQTMLIVQQQQAMCPQKARLSLYHHLKAHQRSLDRRLK